MAMYDATDWATDPGIQGILGMLAGTANANQVSRMPVPKYATLGGAITGEMGGVKNALANQMATKKITGADIANQQGQMNLEGYRRLQQFLGYAPMTKGAAEGAGLNGASSPPVTSSGPMGHVAGGPGAPIPLLPGSTPAASSGAAGGDGSSAPQSIQPDHVPRGTGALGGAQTMDPATMGGLLPLLESFPGGSAMVPSILGYMGKVTPEGAVLARGPNGVMGVQTRPGYNPYIQQKSLAGSLGTNQEGVDPATGAIVPLAGSVQAASGKAGAISQAQAAGAARYKPQTFIDPNGNQYTTNALALGSGSPLPTGLSPYRTAFQQKLGENQETTTPGGNIVNVPGGPQAAGERAGQVAGAQAAATLPSDLLKQFAGYASRPITYGPSAINQSGINIQPEWVQQALKGQIDRVGMNNPAPTAPLTAPPGVNPAQPGAYLRMPPGGAQPAPGAPAPAPPPSGAPAPGASPGAIPAAARAPGAAPGPMVPGAPLRTPAVPPNVPQAAGLGGAAAPTPGAAAAASAAAPAAAAGAASPAKPYVPKPGAAYSLSSLMGGSQDLAPPPEVHPFSTMPIHNPDGSYTSPYNAYTQKVQDEAAKDFAEAHDHWQVARVGQQRLAMIDQGINQLNQSGWSSTGPSAEMKLEGLRTLNSVVVSLGGKPIADPAKIADFEDVLKETKNLGIDRSAALGSREAAQTIQLTIGVNPGILNSYQGAKRIEASMAAASQRDIDYYNWANAYLMKNGTTVGADVAFNNLYPPGYYAGRAIAATIPAGHIDYLEAHPAAAADFDIKYGKGMSAFILHGTPIAGSMSNPKSGAALVGPPPQ